MFHILFHCRPKKENEEYFGKCAGAYASVLIDYKDYAGALELSKYYIKEEGLENLEIEDEYYTFEKREDLPDDYQQYFDDLIEYGYSMIFNLYKEEEEAEK